MTVKSLLMHLGVNETDADELVRTEVPRYQANVAYSESMRDLTRLESAHDFDDDPQTPTP